MKIILKILFLVLFSITSFVDTIADAAQTCNSVSPKATPTNRFRALDGTVMDLQTGLMWKQCSEGMTWDATTGCSGTEQSYNWQDALLQAVNTNNSPAQNFGYRDWRVPNIKEYQSIMETTCEQPAINLAIFPSEPGTTKWSSTAYYSPNLGAWQAAFSDGMIITSGQTGLRSLRLVRTAAP